MGIPPGTQTYPFRNEFAKDIPGTLKALAGIGTRRIELCSPWSYREFAGFKEYKPADLRKLLDSNNIVAESCHYGMPEFKSNLDERISWAKELGMKQMILAIQPRISKGTSRSAKRKQIGSDRFRMLLHLSEDP